MRSDATGWPKRQQGRSIFKLEENIFGPGPAREHVVEGGIERVGVLKHGDGERRLGPNNQSRLVWKIISCPNQICGPDIECSLSAKSLCFLIITIRRIRVFLGLIDFDIDDPDRQSTFRLISEYSLRSPSPAEAEDNDR